MKKGILILAATIFTFSIQSCRKISGDGPTITDTRNISGFSGIDLGLDATVYYTQGSDYKVEIHAQKNIADAIESNISGNELKLRYDRHKIVGHHDRVFIYITAPNISSLNVSGSGEIRVSQTFTPQNLDLDVSGSGSISIDEVETNYLYAKISGSGEVFVNNGHTDGEKTDISGSGNIDMLNVPARTATTHTSGSGTTKVNVSESLEVHISGSGDVYYKGNPALSVSISGSGKVKPW